MASGACTRCCARSLRSAATTPVSGRRQFSSLSVKRRGRLSRPYQITQNQLSRRQSSNTSFEADIWTNPGVFAAARRGSVHPLHDSPVLAPDDLFHPFSSSPLPRIQRRAAFIKNHAFCPHPDHQRTRMPLSPTDPEHRKQVGNPHSKPPALVRFECPDCGIPAYCSEEHWVDDYEHHLETCIKLAEINKDDHDLNSGRDFPEYVYGGELIEEFPPNFLNWDALLYTRQFNAINDERRLRHATRLLTYPFTIGSILSELSPYGSYIGKNRITHEGLRSFGALRYNLHPRKTGGNATLQAIRPRPPRMRIFILGARAESSLPRDVWVQLSYLFPRADFNLIFIGPESMIGREKEFANGAPQRTASNPFGAILDPDIYSMRMKVTTYVDYFHTLYTAQAFQPFDPYFDCFVLFHPGLGHPASQHEWAETLPQLVETKLPIIVTGYSDFDMQRDLDWVHNTVGGEIDILLEPGENMFRSLRWEMNDYEPADITCGNWGVWAFRGKRYEAIPKGDVIAA